MTKMSAVAGLPPGSVAVTTARPGLIARTSPSLTTATSGRSRAPFDAGGGRDDLARLVEQVRRQRDALAEAEAGAGPVESENARDDVEPPDHRLEAAEARRERRGAGVAGRQSAGSRSKDAFVVSPSSQVMRASGMGVESAAWATALN